MDSRIRSDDMKYQTWKSPNGCPPNLFLPNDKPNHITAFHTTTHHSILSGGAPTTSMLCLLSLLRVWERLQVELHGQYSVARFEALVRYQARHPTCLRALVITILGPLPLLLLIVSIDAMPLVPVTAGFLEQNCAFWLRIFLLGWIPPFTLIYQTWIIAPVLPMSTTRLGAIMTLIGVHTCAMSAALTLIIGFPVPFAIVFEGGPYMFVFCTALWLSWKDTLRTNPLARPSLKRYRNVLCAQIVMMFLYIGFNVVFNQLHGLHQTMFSCLLPLIKLFFKNCVSRGVFHLQDLSPTVVVFFVDVFHALFVSFTMQQASSNGANIVVMAVDMTQTGVAYYELSQVLARIHTLIREDRELTSPKSQHRSSIQHMVSVIDYAINVLHTMHDVRTHPLMEHLQGSDGSIVVLGSKHESLRQGAPTSRVFPLIDSFPSQPSAETPGDTREGSQPPLHVESVKAVLKLLHMIEFYVLIEYVEAMLSGTYALYMVIMSYLPNHRHYIQFNHLSGAELRVTAMHVGVFAAAEILSLVVFCIIVDHKVKHFSTLRHLAFALESNGKIIYAVTVGWVFIIVQISLEHFGEFHKSSLTLSSWQNALTQLSYASWPQDATTASSLTG